MGFLQAVILQCFERCICFFCRMGNTSFPPSVRSSLLPNLDILGVPIGDYLHCTRFISEKISQAKVLLAALVEVAAADLHVATSLLRISFCKLHCATSWIYDSVYSAYMLNIHTNIREEYALLYFADRTRIACRIFCVYSILSRALIVGLLIYVSVHHDRFRTQYIFGNVSESVSVY